MPTLKTSLSKATLSVFVGAFALLTATAAASAQDDEVRITRASPPKMVGLWMVETWARGKVGSHCSAERPFPRASGSGGTLQFLLTRSPGGYRIVLVSDEWEFKPWTRVRVEISAKTVMQFDANAIDNEWLQIEFTTLTGGKLLQRLAGAPMIEVKIGKSVFKLPFDGFSDALSEVNDCYVTLRKPVTNPFAAPTPKTASR